MLSRTKRFVPALAVSLVLACGTAVADWTQWRGPNHDGRSPDTSVFDGDFGLERSWKIPLGSAYSGIVVGDGVAVTMFADGDSDFLAALDVDSGRERWRYRIDRTYKGHDGSDDGPLSSPAIDGDRVYGLGPWGKLFAVRLADGGEIWSVDLQQRFEAQRPEYGFTSTPVIEGERLIVMTGGPEGRALAALDKKTGETVWTALKALVEYQSPVPMTLAGRRQIVVADKDTVWGLAPEDGTVLWSYDHRGTGSSPSPSLVPLGDDRFLIKFWTSIAAFEVSRSDTGMEARKLYAAEVFGRSYLPPVLHEGHLYGFTAQFLTCVNAETGERVWRSRPPGGAGLVLVDGKLVIFASEGWVVVADPTPQGYVELARTRALDRGSFTWPSFADGRVFVRDLKELAVVRVTKTSAAVAVEPEPTPGGEFQTFLDRNQNALDRQRRVNAYLEDKTFPLVQDGRWVSFIYRGEAEDVAVMGSMLETGAAESLERFADTDLYHRTFEARPDDRWEYRFQVDFEDSITDPLNPVSVPDRRKGDWSVVTLPEHPEVDHLADPAEDRRGRLETLVLASTLLKNKRQIKIYLPAGYQDGAERYPLLVVNEGKGWIDKGLMTRSLDNLIGRSVAPLIVAFVEKPRTSDWWHELGRGRSAKYSRMLVEELLPKLDARYRTIREPGSRAIMGTIDSARLSVYAALKHPDVFGKVAVRSMSLDTEIGREILQLLAAEDRPPLQFYLDWNRYERRNANDGYDRRADSEQFAEALERHAYGYTGGERPDGSGWSSLRAGTAPMLEALFPLRR